jgi:AraC family transcriptional regulator
MAVTHIKCDRADNGLTTPIPREDAFLITLQIRDCPKHKLWLDDRAVRAGHLKPGAVSIYDLRRNPIVYSVSPFRSLHFYLPRRAVNTVADLEGMARVDAFNNNPGLGVEDPVIFALGASLLPAFQRPAEASRVFVDHITLATAAHVLKAYGAGGRPPLPFEGSLAPWQERRAKEMFSARLDGATSIAQVATECGMPPSAFLRAFRQATGTLPHRWLLQQRIEHAKFVLCRWPQTPLEQIASVSGFASVPQLVRIFMRFTGMHPEGWRRR